MPYLTSFMIAVISVLVLGATTKIIVDLFGSDRTARVAAVAVAVGYSIQNVEYEGPANAEGLMALATAVGSLVAIGLLWYRLIKRPRGYSAVREDEA